VAKPGSNNAAWWVVGGLTVAAIAGLMIWKTRTPVSPSPAQAAQEGPDSLRVGRHLFRVSNENPGQGTLEILSEGQPAQRIAGGAFSLTDLGQDDPGWKNGADINGDGIPEVIVRESTGGAHCCISWRIFSAGPAEAKQIYQFDNGHTDFFPFFDANGDGKLEVKRYDWTFAYWNAGFAQSPAIVLIYAWQNGAYRFSPELTRNAPFSDEEMQKRIQDLDWDSPEPEAGAPAGFWSNMLDLIGTGNAAQVADYVNAAWPSDQPGRPEFMAKFSAQVRQSPYWGDLNVLNGGKLAAELDRAR
jgi:hypothetical protein